MEDEKKCEDVKTNNVTFSFKKRSIRKQVSRKRNTSDNG